MSTGQLLEILNKLPFWESLTESQKEQILNSAKVSKYDKNSELTSQEYSCTGMLLVNTGSLRVYIMSEDGKEITLYRVSAGDVCVLSAACALSSITFDIHISSIEESTIVQIDSKAVETIMNKNMEFELFAYKTASERFSDVMWAMQQVLFMSFDKRLAIFLIDETVNRKSNVLNITHEEIAKHLGSAREVVTRMLKYFSTEGLVELSRGKIKIIDRKKLLSLT